MLTDRRLLTNEAIASRKFDAGNWFALAQRLFLAGHKYNRLPKELAGLSDHMLLDIGVDPRRVPNPAGEMIPRPDLTRKGLATPIWRTTARS